MNPKTLMALLTVPMAAELHATVLVNETFADGDRATFNPPGSLSWHYGAHRSSEAFTSLTVGSNQMVWDHTAAAAVNSFSGVIGHFTAGGSPVTVAIGETLRLTFDVSFSGGSFTDATGAFRWALLNSNNNQLTADFAGNNETGLSTGTGGTLFSGWRGYEGQTIVHPTATTTTGLFTRERTGSGNGLFTSGNWTSLAGSGVTNPATTAGNTLTATLELTRTAGGMQVVAGYNGTFTTLVTDASPVTSFDTIAFFMLDGNSHNATLSNIQLELIPEPSALLLGGLGLVAPLVRRRR